MKPIKELSAIESVLDSLEGYFNQKIDSHSSVYSIYLYGSYVRGDFVLGKSDLDFAVFLDLPDEVHHWDHPDFLNTYKLTEEVVNTLPKEFFRSSSTLSKCDCISFSLAEVKKIQNYEPFQMVGPLNRLTFYAFDFINNNRLLWGNDILKSYTIPDPLQYKTQRFNWMKSSYFNRKQRGYDKKQNLILSVGVIISFLAIFDGIRDLRKNIILNWSKNYSLFQEHKDFAKVIEKYYEFILNLKVNSYLDEFWFKQAENFVEWIYSENFSID